MNEANAFLDKFSSIKNSPNFWWQYSQFTKKIGESDIDKLIQKIPDVIAKVENNGASNELYRNLLQACEIDINFGKQLYERVIQSNNERLLSLIHSIISGVSKKDFRWAKEKTLILIEDSNKYINNQAIYSIGLFHFPQNKSKGFIGIIDEKFNEIIKAEKSEEILTSIIFACRNQRKILPNADHIILSLLKVESNRVKIELLNILIYNIELDEEKEFCKKILLSLISIDLKFELAYNSLAYHLKKHIADNFITIQNFLNSWISFDKKNARNIKLLKPILDETYNLQPDSFRKIITEWLNNNSNNFHIAVFALMQEMNYQNITFLKLDSGLIEKFDFKDIEYITKKIIGYIPHHEIATSLLYSILEVRHKDEKVVLHIANIFVEYLIFNYYSTIEFLKERKKNCNVDLKKIIINIIDEGEKYYSAYKDLEFLKEFEPSESRLDYMNKIQNKKFNKSYEENKGSRNSLSNMFTTLHFRAGKTAFGKFEGEYSDPMQPQLISHRAEMPRGEFIDPMGQALLRIECRNFKRKK